MDAAAPPRCLGCAAMSDLARSFNDVAAAYDAAARATTTDAIDAIAAAAGGGPRLLDLGAGTGRLSAPAAGAGFDVVAVEPLDDDARDPGARRSAPSARWPARAEALPLPDASVDGAVCSDAWHWFDGARAADELARVVRPGGGVVVCVTYPRWHGSDDAPDWWLRPRASIHAACRRATTRASTRLAPSPTASRAIRPSRRSQPRDEPFVHHTDRDADRRALGLDVVRGDAARRSARRRSSAELDAMLARRGVDDGRHPRTAPSCGSLGAGPRQRRAQVLGQRRADVDRLARSPGARRPAARRAGTGARGRRRPGVPYSGSPATGWPMACRWARIWCVRPVSRRTRSSVVARQRLARSRSA